MLALTITHPGGSVTRAGPVSHLARRVFDAEVPRRGDVLEVGCGHGTDQPYMALSSPDRHVTGIDIDARNIAVASHALSHVDHSAAHLEFHRVAPGEIPEVSGRRRSRDVLYLLERQDEFALLTITWASSDHGVLVLKEQIFAALEYLLLARKRSSRPRSCASTAALAFFHADRGDRGAPSKPWPPRHDATSRKATCIRMRCHRTPLGLRSGQNYERRYSLAPWRGWKLWWLSCCVWLLLVAR